MKTVFLLAASLIAIAGLTHATGKTRVDLALVLAIDCSYSVDETEFHQQVSGTAQAFLDPRVFEAILDGPHQRIAVSVMQWSSHDEQHQVVPWRLVANRSDLYALAQEISALERRTQEGGTSISAAILEGLALLDTAPFASDRRVIDVSADGENNNGPTIKEARAFALSKGVTLNGLTILNEVSYLNYYFENRVIGGEGAFVEIASGYRDYSRAILRKLLREIKGIVIS